MKFKPPPSFKLRDSRFASSAGVVFWKKQYKTNTEAGYR
jgi:hypothetical protein